MKRLAQRFARSALNLLVHPRRSINNVRTKGVHRYFTLQHYREPPNFQHPMIDESKVLELVKGKTVLDCGCGRGRWGYLLSKLGYEVVGFDIYQKYVEDARGLGAYKQLHVLDATQKLPFGDCMFDTVLAVELLEHLLKEGGQRFLEEALRVAKNRVVLTTPVGYYEYEGRNIFETHKSGWADDELLGRGFKCSVHSSSLYDWLLCLYEK